MSIASKWAEITGRRSVEVDPAEEVMGQARAFLEWSSMPYHKRFMQWIEYQIDQPVDIKDHLSMVGQMARANTFKEIRIYLRQLEQRAHEALEE